MISIIPISVTKVNPTMHKLVEWKLGNTCNYDCSFCGIENKSGTEYWLDLELYKSVCKKLMDQSDAEGKKIFFQFTGGEPTLYSGLLDLFKYIASFGHYIKMFSNGSRTLRWWKELADADVLDTLYLTVHVEQNPDINHLVEVIKLFQYKPVFVLAQCTAHVFDKAYTAHTQILNESVVFSSLKPINKGYEHDAFVEKYTNEQTEILKVNGFISSINYNQLKTHKKIYSGSRNVKIEYSDNSSEITTCYNLLTTGNNAFQGWQCSIGIDYICIVYDKVYRGVCRVGGVASTIYDKDIGFQTENVICTKQRCTCLTDLGENKVR